MAISAFPRLPEAVGACYCLHFSMLNMHDTVTYYCMDVQ